MIKVVVGCQACDSVEWDTGPVPAPGAVHPDLCRQTLHVPVPRLRGPLL